MKDSLVRKARIIDLEHRLTRLPPALVALLAVERGRAESYAQANLALLSLVRVSCLSRPARRDPSRWQKVKNRETQKGIIQPVETSILF